MCECVCVCVELMLFLQPSEETCGLTNQKKKKTKVIHLSEAVSLPNELYFYEGKQSDSNTCYIHARKRHAVREVVRGDKHNQRKSANRNAQISVIHSAHYTGLCLYLQFADFLRLCLSPRTTSRTISFSISNSF